MHTFVVLVSTTIATLVAAHQGDPVITAKCAPFPRAKQRPNTPRAMELGMNQTWYAEMPCTNMTEGTKTTGDDLQDYFQAQWGARKSGFYAPGDVSFVTDPFSNSSDGSAVMRVYYQKGSYTPSGSDDDVTGGCQFYMSPFEGQAFKKGLVRYDVAFSDNFDWVKGGKLPGVFGGKLIEKRSAYSLLLIHWILLGAHGTRGCTGGDMANGDNCFSVRLMWRENGKTMNDKSSTRGLM